MGTWAWLNVCPRAHVTTITCMLPRIFCLPLRTVSVLVVITHYPVCLTHVTPLVEGTKYQ